MKIAIDIRLLGRKRTGDEVVFFNLIRGLSRVDQKNEYILLTDSAPEKNPDLQDEISRLGLGNNFKVIALAEAGVNKFSWNAWVLPNYLRNNPVDILQVQYITPWFVPKNIKIATIIHDVSFKVFPELIRKTDMFFLNILIPHSFKRANTIIGVSKFTSDEIMKYYKVDKTKVEWIHNAVSDNFFEQYSQTDIDAVREKYHLPEKFILYLGTLQPRKNLPTLIEAFVKMPLDSRKDIKLVLAGGKGHNYDRQIDKFIKEYGVKEDVLLTGFIDEIDKPIIFKLAHVFCFPSVYEGFGIPILEAMAMGVPALVSNIPPHLEITGDSAFTFDPQNSSILSEKLARLCTDINLRDSLIQKQNEQIKKFSWEETARKILVIYEKLNGQTMMIDNAAQKK